jgi:hypothetical protein
MGIFEEHVAEYFTYGKGLRHNVSTTGRNSVYPFNIEVFPIVIPEDR